MPLYFPSALNSSEERTLKLASFSSARTTQPFLVSLVAFPDSWALYTVVPPIVKGQYDRTKGICCLFLPIWGNASKVISINGCQSSLYPYIKVLIDIV